MSVYTSIPRVPSRRGWPPHYVWGQWPAAALYVGVSGRLSHYVWGQWPAAALYVGSVGRTEASANSRRTAITMPMNNGARS